MPRACRHKQQPVPGRAGGPARLTRGSVEPLRAAAARKEIYSQATARSALGGKHRGGLLTSGGRGCTRSARGRSAGRASRASTWRTAGGHSAGQTPGLSQVRWAKYKCASRVGRSNKHAGRFRGEEASRRPSCLHTNPATHQPRSRATAASRPVPAEQSVMGLMAAPTAGRPCASSGSGTVARHLSLRTCGRDAGAGRQLHCEHEHKGPGRAEARGRRKKRRRRRRGMLGGSAAGRRTLPVITTPAPQLALQTHQRDTQRVRPLVRRCRRLGAALGWARALPRQRRQVPPSAAQPAALAAARPAVRCPVLLRLAAPLLRALFRLLPAPAPPPPPAAPPAHGAGLTVAFRLALRLLFSPAAALLGVCRRGRGRGRGRAALRGVGQREEREAELALRALLPLLLLPLLVGVRLLLGRARRALHRGRGRPPGGRGQAGGRRRPAGHRQRQALRQPRLAGRRAARLCARLSLLPRLLLAAGRRRGVGVADHPMIGRWGGGVHDSAWGPGTAAGGGSAWWAAGQLRPQQSMRSRRGAALQFRGPGSPGWPQPCSQCSGLQPKGGAAGVDAPAAGMIGSMPDWPTRECPSARSQMDCKRCEEGRGASREQGEIQSQIAVRSRASRPESAWDSQQQAASRGVLKREA